MATLEEIRDLCRERADMEESEFVTDATFNSHINASLAELHDLLVAAYADDYYLNEYDFTTIADTKNYAVPSDFYKVRGVDAYLSGLWTEIHKFNWNKRNQDNVTLALTLRNYTGLRYRLMGANIVLSRTPDPGTAMKLWYTPKLVELVNDSDTWTDINGYLEYVIVDVAMKVLNKEESDVSVLMATKQQLHDRLVAMSANRDANEPESVSDVYDDDYFPSF